MAIKIYVGNLSFNFDNEVLAELFSRFGQVQSARVVTDHGSGRSKGFGFVEMSTDAEAQNAIQKLNGVAQDGRPLTVNEAKPTAPRDNHRNSGRASFPSRSRF